MESPKFLQNERDIIFGSQNNSIAFSVKSGPWDVKEMGSQKKVNEQTITLLEHPDSQNNAEHSSEHFFEEIRLESPQ